MSNYIDGFAFPISKLHLKEYEIVASKVANIWKEHGALGYFEYVGDDLNLEGTLPFPKCLGAKTDETIIFGWVAFDSRDARDLANEKVAADPRMSDLVAPLMDPSKIVFDAGRMAYGGFRSLLQST